MRAADPLLIAYFVTTITAGASCVAAAWVLVHLNRDRLAGSFLGMYLPWTALVAVGLAATLADLPSASSTMREALAYGESFIGRYALMLALPLFAHRFFDLRDRRRDLLVAGLVLAAFALQHVTEFGLAGTVWDDRGDLLEDVFAAGLLVYVLRLALKRRRSAPYPALASRFGWVVALALPTLGLDLFVVDGPGWRLYPLVYGITGIAFVLTLIRRYHATGGRTPPDWALSPREEEVLHLVRRGMSTRGIAEELTISPNTVKTHLRSIFDKSGFRSRNALLAHADPSSPGVNR